MKVTQLNIDESEGDTKRNNFKQEKTPQTQTPLIFFYHQCKNCVKQYRESQNKPQTQMLQEACAGGYSSIDFTANALYPEMYCHLDMRFWLYQKP